RRFGAAIADRLLTPMTLGIYGADPKELGAADAFPALARMERDSGGVLRALMKKRGDRREGGNGRRILTFEGGMESRPRALAGARGRARRLAPPVGRTGADGEGPVAPTARGPLRARGVLLAGRAPDRARLVAPLSEAAAELLSAVRYVPMVVAGVGIPPGGSP